MEVSLVAHMALIAMLIVNSLLIHFFVLFHKTQRCRRLYHSNLKSYLIARITDCDKNQPQ